MRGNSIGKYASQGGDDSSCRYGCVGPSHICIRECILGISELSERLDVHVRGSVLKHQEAFGSQESMLNLGGTECGFAAWHEADSS